MTAEIALLNRRALAFAADSAVTISDGTTDKIYNSAEKIFELSRKVPLGLMLYNTTEFVGVPLDVLVRKFRAECDEEFVNSSDACDKLVLFLQQFDHSDADEGSHLRAVMAEELEIIIKEHRKEFYKLMDAIDLSDRKSAVKEIEKVPAIPKQAYINVIKQRCVDYEARPFAGFLTTETLDTFTSKYGNFITRLVKTRFKQIPSDAQVLDEITRLAWLMVKSDTFSGALTGLVNRRIRSGMSFPDSLCRGN